MPRRLRTVRHQAPRHYQRMGVEDAERGMDVEQPAVRGEAAEEVTMKRQRSNAARINREANRTGLRPAQDHTVSEETIVMRQIAILFAESLNPAVVRAAAMTLANRGMLLIASPTQLEHRRNLQLLADAWNARHSKESP